MGKPATVENLHPFVEAFRGTFYGVLRWEQLDDLWNVLKADAADGWFVYAVGETPPEEAVSGDQLILFIDEVDQLLRKEHEEDYCGIVYTDSFEQPTYVKIFDPNNLGVSCGFSDNPPKPGWILSKMAPVDLEENMPLPGNRRRWWQKLFS